MTDTTIGTVEVQCGICGSKIMKREDGQGDGDKVTCSDCGAFMGTVGALKTAAFEKAKSAVPEIAEALRKAFKFKS